MVQLYYYENRGRCARKLLRHDGYSGGSPGSSKTRVLLFPYEGWAQPAAATYWLIKTVWWSRSRSSDKHARGQLRHTMKSPPCLDLFSSCHAHCGPFCHL